MLAYSIEHIRKRNETCHNRYRLLVGNRPNRLSKDKGWCEMTWKELKEKALDEGFKWGSSFNNKEYVVLYKNEITITLNEGGSIELKDGWNNELTFYHKTYDQMWQIMEALK